MPELEKVDKAVLGITEGRIIHYQYETEPGIVKCRAGIIVNAWRTAAYEYGEVNLTVFTDWSNDRDVAPNGVDGLVWKTSVPYYEPNRDPSRPPGDRLPNTWHFPER